METLAFTHLAMEDENPKPDLKLRSFTGLNLRIPQTIAVSLLAFGVATSLFIHAECAQALMQNGDQGSEVAELQRQLGIQADGFYGSQTEAAVRAFQTERGLEADGIAGPETLSALGLPAGLSASGSATPYTPGITNSAFSATVSAKQVKVYSSPSRSASVRYLLHRGDRVSFTNRVESGGSFQWRQLAGGGWVASPDFVAPLRASNSGTGNTGGVGGDVDVAARARVTASSGLLVRNAPAGDVIDSLGYGTFINLTGASRYADGQNWVQLTSGNWVAEAFITYQ